LGGAVVVVAPDVVVLVDVVAVLEVVVALLVGGSVPKTYRLLR
jgi:hypothetical protein